VATSDKTNTIKTWHIKLIGLLEAEYYHRDGKLCLPAWLSGSAYRDANGQDCDCPHRSVAIYRLSFECLDEFVLAYLSISTRVTGLHEFLQPCNKQW